MTEFFIKIFLHLLALLPLRGVHALAAALGWLALKLPINRVTCVSRVNIKLCFPQLSPAEQELLVKANVIETAKCFAELGIIWLRPAQEVLALVKQVTGAEILEAAAREGRGVVALTPHLGSWELSGLYIAAHYQIASLYRPSSRFPQLETLVRQARERTGARLLPTDGAGLRALQRALKQGSIAGILPDHEPTKFGHGVFAPFFGIPAFTAMLVPRLARHYQSPVIFIYTERLPKGQGFHLHYLPAPPEIYSTEMTQAITALNRGIENCVERCPEQYLWAYKRFKSRPAQEPSIYKDCSR